MTQIHAYTSAHCSFDDARERLYAYFKDGTGTLPLGIVAGDLRVETDVVIRFRDRSEYPGYHIIDVGWKPAAGGPFPEFNGTLSIAQDATDWSRLDLDGAYRAPFGIAGAAFDAVVGHRIAEATAEQLLGKLKEMLTHPNEATV